MASRFGCPDKQQRKHRSDAGKSRKKYRGKLVKGKRQIKFDRRIGNKNQIKVWIWERLPISISGRLRWNKHVRPYIKPEITKFRMVHIVNVSEFNTREKIERFMEENYWDGKFIIMGWSHAKTRTRLKPVKLCKVIVRKGRDGIKAIFRTSYRMHRYWFWRK